MSRYMEKVRVVRAQTAEGVMSANRPSTDARGAIETWALADERRSQEVINDEDDYLVVELSTDSADTNAGEFLEQCCNQNGVRRVPEG